MFTLAALILSFISLLLLTHTVTLILVPRKCILTGVSSMPSMMARTVSFGSLFSYSQTWICFATESNMTQELKRSPREWQYVGICAC